MARKKSKKKAGTKPFASKAQQGLFFAKPSLRKYARKKAHASGQGGGTKASKAAYARLPRRKGVKKRAR